MKTAKSYFRLFSVLVIGGAIFGLCFRAEAADLKGRILLQVQDKGQAWYVYPKNGQRYFLGRPDDAFSVMRSLGLGVANSDIADFKNGAPRRLSGYILLQVQDRGQAYYVNPADLKLNYLGRPQDAFSLMRRFGLGISNADLASIRIYSVPSAPASPVSSATAHNYAFSYEGNTYQISADLSPALYAKYSSAPKVYTYTSDNAPADLREAFYGVFLQPRSDDDSLNALAAKIKAIAASKNWTSDETADFTLAFIQSIPYDHKKLAGSGNRNTNPYYPYETLYLDRGVCSDKTFLAVALFRKLGYGAAILDFPGINHSAVGIECPAADSVNGSGYCYGETTNYFRFGVIPQSISGQAQASSDQSDELFNTSGLGEMEIYQKTSGLSYNEVPSTRAKAADLKALKDGLASQETKITSAESALRAQEAGLKTLKDQLDGYLSSGQNSLYNASVPVYNDMVKTYNSALSDYRNLVADYNQKVADFNAKTKVFYR